MSCIRQTSSKSAQAAGFSASVRALLRLSLVISTWNGPLPLVHAHSLDATSGIPQSVLLRQHVAEFHEDAAEAGEHYVSWHVHWLMPGDWESYPCHHTSDGKPDDLQNHGASCGGIAVLAKTASSVTNGCDQPVWLPQLAHACSLDVSLDQGNRYDNCAPANFLASYQRSIRLNELLSVWRC